MFWRTPNELQNPDKVKRMTEKNLKLDEVLEELHALRDENYFLKRQSNDLKMSCSDYSLRITKLENELSDIKHMSMWGFADKYCNDDELEEAGHALARSFGIGVKKDSFVEAEIAAEKAEQETVSAMSSYLGVDF